MAITKNKTLTKEETTALGMELDAIRQDVINNLGVREASYIRKVLLFSRYSEIGGRALLMASIFPLAWLLGTALLSISKIVNNMELGHNIMHGQYDWMNDPYINSHTFQWDNTCVNDDWRYSHNYIHHHNTNVACVDKDLGFGLRVTDCWKWKPRYLLQVITALLLALFFQWAVGTHNLGNFRNSKKLKPMKKAMLKLMMRQFAKDYILFPLLAWPIFLPVLLGNMVANIVRNLWACMIIFCGHFTTNVVVFPKSVLANETHGEWYLRQIGGSSNIEGRKLFHFLTGHLSYQIEHHLFPDIPTICLPEISIKVRKICARYGQNYNTGRLSRQFGGVIFRILRCSFPPRNSPLQTQ